MYFSCCRKTVNIVPQPGIKPNYVSLMFAIMWRSLVPIPAASWPPTPLHPPPPPPPPLLVSPQPPPAVLPVQILPQHLSYDARCPSSHAAFHLTDCNSLGDFRELIAWPLKLSPKMSWFVCFIRLAIQKTPSGDNMVNFFLCLRLCQPDGMLCIALSINVGSLCLLDLSHLASLLQGVVDFEPCMLLL